jgi:hypothetical protein
MSGVSNVNAAIKLTKYSGTKRIALQVSQCAIFVLADFWTTLDNTKPLSAIKKKTDASPNFEGKRRNSDIFLRDEFEGQSPMFVVMVAW